MVVRACSGRPGIEGFEEIKKASSRNAFSALKNRDVAVLRLYVERIQRIETIQRVESIQRSKGFSEREYSISRELLLHSYSRLLSRRAAGGGGARGEEVMVVQRAVELAADFGGLGAEGRAAALEKDHGNDVPVLRVRV